MYGASYEIVYRNSSSSEYLSELQWDIKPLFVLGLGFTMEPSHNTWGFFTDISIQAGLPGKTGTMEDRDWLTSGKLTNFSSHTNKLKTAFLLTLNAGYSFSITDRFFIRPFGSLDYYYFKMEGWDGYRSYEYENWEIIALSGLVIRYTQQWFLFSPGLSVGFTTSRFTIKGAVKITPVIYCTGEDDHLYSGKIVRYNDYMFGKLTIEPTLDLSYAINSHLEIGFVFLYRYIKGTRGDTVESNSNYYSNSAGAGLSLFESSLYMKITL